MPAQTVIKIRRDTSTNWNSVNPIVAAGEIAFETDTNKIKVGDGSSTWTALAYASGAGTATEVSVDASTFNGILSTADTNVQLALDTLDNLDISAGVTTSDDPPAAPANGDLWWESDTGILFIYYDNFWVQAVSGVVGPQGDDGVEVGVTPPSNTEVLWIDTNTDATVESTLNTGTAGQVVLSDGTAGVKFETGFLLREIVTFTSSGTFTKADYPWLKAIRVKLVCGGGGGGGNEATQDQSSQGGGGGGGAYGESFFSDMSLIPTSVAVTVGAGGAGAFFPDKASNGGLSSFGTLVSGFSSALGGQSGRATTTVELCLGGAGGSGLSSNAELVVSGSAGGNGLVNGGIRQLSGFGGHTFLGGATPSGGNDAGTPGVLFGSGGAAALRGPFGSAFSGGVGGNGVVILELFA